MDWKELGLWAAGIVSALAAAGVVVKVVFGAKKTHTTTIKTVQKGNMVGGNMAGRDNISDGKK